jgi:SAM-dependent methyltransferase
LTVERHRPYIFDSTQHDVELSRLRALENIYDSATRRFLLTAGVRPGWRCLEVGAGAGSIANWLSETVEPAGHVLAVDVNTRFLSVASATNLDVCETDIRTASIEPASFDVAHTRFVLVHVPEWAEALAALFAAVTPGGWVALEEPDFSSARSHGGPSELRRAFDNVHQAVRATFEQRGMDAAFGARLPVLLQESGLEDLVVERDAAIVAGGSPLARMMATSTALLADKYIATGLATGEDIERYGRFAADPTCRATYYATIRVAGRKRASP